MRDHHAYSHQTNDQTAHRGIRGTKLDTTSSSLQDITATRREATYAASKAAVTMLTKNVTGPVPRSLELLCNVNYGMVSTSTLCDPVSSGPPKQYGNRQQIRRFVGDPYGIHWASR